jgi:tRNA-dihydrouridine synthase
MKIGNVTLPDRAVMLAPMEDVTDVGFRLQCRHFCADMVYSDFVSADALIRSIDKTM